MNYILYSKKVVYTLSMLKNCGNDCPDSVKLTLDVIGDKYSALIIRLLHEGDKRFKDFEHDIPGINPRTLSKRLERLQALHIIAKTENNDTAHHSYTLTKSGKDLNDVIHSMALWGEKHAV